VRLIQFDKEEFIELRFVVPLHIFNKHLARIDVLTASLNGRKETMAESKGVGNELNLSMLIAMAMINDANRKEELRQWI
jgi:hypothetical protein